jgi:hypothetical protein
MAFSESDVELLTREKSEITIKIHAIFYLLSLEKDNFCCCCCSLIQQPASVL